MRQVKTGARPDPAPSRWSYRIQRWMLTPAIRSALRIGVPLALFFGGIFAFFSDADRRDEVAHSIVDLRRQIETRPEFMVNLLAVEGASPAVEFHIRDVFPYDLPSSSFDVDLAAIRESIVALPAVSDASVRLRKGGVLVAEVTEREPVAIWRMRGGLAIVDETGVVLAGLRQRSERADLPVIAGDGANEAVSEALALFAAATPLQDRVRGLVRVGERRWDVVLDRGQRVLLPENRALSALERVVVFSDLQDLLERDITVVDMRLSSRPTVRLTQRAISEWWRITQISTGPTTGADP